MDNTWAIRENLRRFRDLLKSEKDEAKRRILEKLITEELAQLPDQRAIERWLGAHGVDTLPDECASMAEALRGVSNRDRGDA